MSTIETVKEDLAGWRLNRVVNVAVGGCLSEDNLQILARGGSGYIVGVPLWRSKEASQGLFANRSSARWHASTASGRRRRPTHSEG